jgi:phosphopantothenoylcysteine synthetase/decarboxylase
MRVLITGGPSSEPIDRVRTLTNHATGELAVKLGERFAAHGDDVELFLGVKAIRRAEHARYFRTNEELELFLNEIEKRDMVDVFLHAAALSDFRVDKITVIGGKGDTEKISSDAESLQIDLVRKPKLIRKLRDLFPNAYLVGWKFELDGTRDQVIEKGIRQIRENQTDACIVNGDAFGEGFGLCDNEGLIQTVRNRDELADLLLKHVSTLPIDKRLSIHPHGF